MSQDSLKEGSVKGAIKGSEPSDKPNAPPPSPAQSIEKFLVLADSRIMLSDGSIYVLEQDIKVQSATDVQIYVTPEES